MIKKREKWRKPKKEIVEENGILVCQKEGWKKSGTLMLQQTGEGERKEVAKLLGVGLIMIGRWRNGKRGSIRSHSVLV